MFAVLHSIKLSFRLSGCDPTQMVLASLIFPFLSGLKRVEITLRRPKTLQQRLFSYETISFPCFGEQVKHFRGKVKQSYSTTVRVFNFFKLLCDF